MAAVHFDAQLSPGPDVSHGSPDLGIIDGGHKVTNNLLELLEGLGLDFPDLILTDTPQVEVTGGFVGAPCWLRDLRIARDIIIG